MRMFLVAMCDIFLILYLTVMIEHGGYKPSKITVADYKLLEESEAQLALELDQLKAEMSSLLAEREALASVNLESRELVDQLREKQAAQSEMLAELRSEKERADLQVEEVSKRAQAAEQAHHAVLQRQELLEKDLMFAKTREQELDAELRKHAGELESARASLETARREVTEVSEKSEAEKLEAAMAAAAAQERAHLAEQQAKLLSDQLDSARRRSHEAAQALETSESERAAAQSRAEAAGLQADAAREQVAELDSRLKNVVRDSEEAFQDKIAPYLVLLSATVEREGLLGGITRKTVTRGVPVRFKDHQVIFQYLPEIGIDAGERYLDVQVTVNSLAVQKVYISRSAPIAAFVFPGSIKAAGEGIAARELMPILIAIRNDSRIEFSDRIRGLERNYMPIRRDRLVRRGGHRMEYVTSGFRGTGDFAERILAGDQIVDLSGKLVGVAESENMIVLPLELSDWKQADLRKAFN